MYGEHEVIIYIYFVIYICPNPDLCHCRDIHLFCLKVFLSMNFINWCGNIYDFYSKNCVGLQVNFIIYKMSLLLLNIKIIYIVFYSFISCLLLIFQRKNCDNHDSQCPSLFLRQSIHLNSSTYVRMLIGGQIHTRSEWIEQC